MSSPADTYESYMVPALFAPLATHVVAAARPQSGERVLDVACGTGIVARRIAPVVGPTGQVAGLDLSAAMLAVARATAEQEGQAIAWYEGRAEALPFPDASFDLVVCQCGLQYLPDKQAAAVEWRRVLRDGGRLVVCVTQGLAAHPFEQQFNAVLEQRFGITSLREAYALGDAAELRGVLEGAGLRRVVIDRRTVAARYPDPARYLTMRIAVFVAAIPSLQHAAAQERDALVGGITDELTPRLRDYIDGDEVRMPIHVQIARATR